jgi:hemolysin III
MNSSGKPKLRGYSHLLATIPAAVAALLLAQRPSEANLQCGVVIYGFTLIFLFAISGFYHVPSWPEKPRQMLRRLDHSMIFVFIAGSFTPFFLLLKADNSGFVLPIVWGGALLGLGRAIFWPHAPRVLTVSLYALLGLVSLPFLPAIAQQLGTDSVVLVVIGGCCFILGALSYARKGPNLLPGWFGYHELFHALVILGAALHYAAIWRIVG